MNKIKNDLTNLKELPIFWMLLSSKELFHSNFISWILETYPKEMGAFFCNILSLDSIYEISGIEREKHNIDISFHLGNTIVIIENKVKSIAYEEQLLKYNDLYQTKNKKCILLSLKKPIFEINNWQYLKYETFIEQLKYLIKDIKVENYHKDLIEDYIKFINILLTEFLPLINVEKIDICNLYVKNTEENILLEKLIKLRIHDLFLKGLFEEIAITLKKELESKEFSISNKVIYKCEENDIVSVTFGMSRSQGLLDIKYKIKKDLIIGIQIQGLQYRQFIEGLDKKEVQEISTDFLANKKWFQFTNQLNKDSTLEIYPLKGVFNRFDSSSGLFLYRSVKLNSLKNKDLFEIIYQDINDIKNI